VDSAGSRQGLVAGCFGMFTEFPVKDEAFLDRVTDCNFITC
jgi:hypothetical protein